MTDTPLPVLLVCGCRTHEAYLRAALSRFTNPTCWHTVGFVGDPTLTEAVYTPDTQIVTLPVPDTYEDLPKKIHAALSWAVARWPDAPGYFKTDDDILVTRLSDLQVAIRNHTASPYWGFVTHKCHAAYVPVARIKGRFNDVSKKPKHQAAHYCFGHGYWLSATAARVAVAAAATYAASYLEDVCTGAVLNGAGIQPVHMPVPYREMPRVPELLNYRPPPTENASSR